VQLAKRMTRLGTETAFKVLAKAKKLEAEGKKIIHLEIGEPDFSTPAHICEAACRFIKEGYTHYVAAAGIPELRQVIAKHIAVSRGIDVHPQEVVITPGAKPIMFFTIEALIDKGDEVIYPDPGFPIYRSVIDFVGGIGKPIALREENDFCIDLNELKKLVNPKTKLMIINSPQNPTGGVLQKEDLQYIAELAQQNDFYILSDEIYCRILYQGDHLSISQFPGMKERTIILDGFSKTYAMTGWRLGYGVMPGALAEHVEKLMINSNSCTSAFIQKAGVEALTGPQDAVTKMVEEFRSRRDFIAAGLNSISGISCRIPKGAFYVFPNIKSTNMSSNALETYLLEKAGVATLAGTSFGHQGEGYLRISYANSKENIEEALSQIKGALVKL
jgi:aspartate aminotransferase